ncbi:MAG: DJ-1/PfpI family protein [Micropepsaceae bacterium]
MPTPATRRVMMLAFADCQILDVTGPLEILASANELKPEAARYEIVLVAEKAGELKTTAGINLVAHKAYGDVSARELAGVHTFMVAGGNGTVAALRTPQLIAFVRRAAKAARRVASVCSGSAILAEAGLLDGKRATSHWNAAGSIAQAYPKLRMEPDAIFVRDGDVWTSAGITAGMDLAIALVEQDLGHAAALEIARRHVLYMMRPGGQSQFSAELQRQRAGARTAAAAAYIAANLQGDLRAGAIAAAAGLSERSLLRAFREELDTTPAEYVERVRVDAARLKLGGARVAAKTVARQCGFSSAELMRRAFHRTLGISPADYRARFATAARGERHA